jgi:phage N-6-adenine-methyltransferase
MMKDQMALFMSDKQDWETPTELFKKINNEFIFTLDVCATSKNAKVDRFISPDIDGLTQFWGQERCWMNPPYGRMIRHWIKKAYESTLYGALVVGLLPARTDTAWFHDFIYNRAEIRFIRGRIRFVGAKDNAPFPSMLAIWRPIE